MSKADGKDVVKLTDKDVVKVSKDFFFEGMILPVDVYLKISSGNYVIIGSKGQTSNFSMLHSYLNPHSEVCVLQTDYTFLVDYIHQLTGKIIGKKEYPTELKIQFISGLTEDALGSLEKSGFTSVMKVQAVSQLVTQMAFNMPEFSEVLKILESLRDEDAKHAMTTCFIALLLCEEMDVRLPAAKEKVAMGCMLHDVGLKFIPKTTLDKAPHLRTMEEQQTYEQHPLKGADALRNVRDVSTDVLLIIAEHHENALGTGFPKKIRDVKISPLAKVVGLSTYFAELIFTQITDGKNMTADEAITFIEDILGQPFNKKAFLGLKNIVNKKHLKDRTG